MNSIDKKKKEKADLYKPMKTRRLPQTATKVIPDKKKNPKDKHKKKEQ